MGWFRRSASAAPTLVSVLTGDGRAAAGAATLLSSRYILTCAHVVNEALGREPLDTHRPALADRLEIVLHDGEVQHRCTARLLVWVPIRPSAGSYWGEGDLAVLELDEPAEASARPVVWGEMTQGLEVRAWHGGGDPISFADTTIKVSDAWFYYADGQLTGGSIGPGYSGGPLVMQGDLSVAVGLVAEHVINDAPLADRQAVRRTLVLPWQHIRDELGRAGAHRVLADCLRVSAADSETVPEGVDDLLWKIFETAEQRERHARLVARKLGYQVPSEGSGAAPPSSEELAAFLFTEKRALATLVESLMKTLRDDQRSALNELLALGRSVEGIRLLSVTEHSDLLEILERANAAHPTLVCRAAREVLRYHVSPPAWLVNGVRVAEAQLPEAVDYVENYHDAPPVDGKAQPMPLLLRLAVYFSSAVADKRFRRRLDEWCEGVRERLGVDRSLLADCRIQAARWAKFRLRPVTRILVELWPDDSGQQDRYRCRIWLVREGSTLERVRPLPDGPYTSEEVGQWIHQAAKRHGNGGGQSPPWVEVLVGPDDVHVPVDTWTAYKVLDELSELGLPPSLGVPEGSRVLGEEYPVALRLREYSRKMPQELQRRQELRRRWEAGYMAPLIIRDDFTAVLTVMDSLKGDITWVVLHGAPADRHRFTHLCLAMGIPVVLWDREAGSLEHAQRLEDIVSTVSLHDLPQQIHDFRKFAYKEPNSSPARPVLVWDDPRVPLPPTADYANPPDAPHDWERTTAG
ncbi:trypsin-like peptidase domain-containing protein [Streptomyces orinoci]|uniref:Trypsin-like peptidase domain-containing protein n=1 Tax=Streptomyces orinoci TaxID=67339 RepID=A0ABV3JUS8_STRON|nr:trypsin-like peptidase domain-containing protein [Streptomyces orinoci]